MVNPTGSISPGTGDTAVLLRLSAAGPRPVPWVRRGGEVLTPGRVADSIRVALLAG